MKEVSEPGRKENPDEENLRLQNGPLFIQKIARHC